MLPNTVAFAFGVASAQGAPLHSDARGALVCWGCHVFGARFRLRSKAIGALICSVQECHYPRCVSATTPETRCLSAIIHHPKDLDLISMHQDKDGDSDAASDPLRARVRDDILAKIPSVVGVDDRSE